MHCSALTCGYVQKKIRTVRCSPCSSPQNGTKHGTKNPAPNKRYFARAVPRRSDISSLTNSPTTNRQTPSRTMTLAPDRAIESQLLRPWPFAAAALERPTTRPARRSENIHRRNVGSCCRCWVASGRSHGIDLIELDVMQPRCGDRSPCNVRLRAGVSNGWLVRPSDVLVGRPSGGVTTERLWVPDRFGGGGRRLGPQNRVGGYWRPVELASAGDTRAVAEVGVGEDAFAGVRDDVEFVGCELIDEEASDDTDVAGCC